MANSALVAKLAVESIATTEMMHQVIREWIAHVLKAQGPVLAPAMRQRAKFKGWLRFELAAHAEAAGATSVADESGYEGGPSRSDLIIFLAGQQALVELKTAWSRATTG